MGLEELLEHDSFLRALARSLLRDEAAADDAAQDAWLQAIERPPARPKPWLAAVARNLSFRAIRERVRRRRREAAAARPERVPSAAEVLERENARRDVVMALLGLEERYRSVVLLRYYEDLPPREIARRLSLPVETVRTRLKRALDALRGRLDREHGGRREGWALALAPFAVPKTAAASAAAFWGTLAVSSKSKVAILLVLLAAGAALAIRHAAGRDGEAPLRTARAEAPPRGAPEAGPGVPATGGAVGPSAGADSPVAGPPARGEGGVRGLVLAGGKPVADARVRLDGLGPPKEARTGADGRFAFEAAGDFTLSAWREGLAPASARIELPAGGTREVLLELPPGSAAELLILDASNDLPVAGARVLVLRAGGSEAREFANALLAERMEDPAAGEAMLLALLPLLEPSELMEAGVGAAQFRVGEEVTGDDGKARLLGLPAGSVDLMVLHEGFVGARLRRGSVVERNVVRLHRGGALEVIAPAVGGNPAEGYLCEVMRDGPPGSQAGFARVGADGRARFAHLPPGRYRVAVSKRGASLAAALLFGEGEAEEPEEEEPGGGLLGVAPVEILPGRLATVDLAAAGAARIEGIYAGATRTDGTLKALLMAEAQLAEVAIAAVGESGRFSFDRVPPGRYTVSILGDGKGRPKSTIEVPPGGGVVRVEIVRPRGRLSGIVHAPDGSPAANAELLLESLGARDGKPARGLEAMVDAFSGETRARADGTFSFEALPGDRYRLYAVVGESLLSEEWNLAEGEERRCEIRFDRAALHRLSVRLLGSDGNPVAGEVAILDARGGAAISIALRRLTLDGSGEGRERFEFRLPPARYRLRIHAPGHAPVGGLVVDLAADEAREVRLARGVPVTVRLRGPGGPLAGAEVALRDASGAFLPTGENLAALLLGDNPPRTDDAGSFTFPRVAPGRYDVLVDGEKAGEAEVGEIALEASITLGG